MNTISGNVSYGGTKSGTIYVAAFRNPTFSGGPDFTVQIDSSGPYTLSGLPDGTYYLAAIIMANGSFAPHDPWGVYGTYTNPQPVTVATGSEVAGIDIVLSDAPNPFVGPTYDIDILGIPQFISHNYIDLTKIGRISKFRSGEGHDYSDSFESCRSMKHYFQPKSNVDLGTISIFSPVTGTITNVFSEQTGGIQLWFKPNEYPAFTVRIFHANPAEPPLIGQSVTAGQLLGTHIDFLTMSDIAVSVMTPNGEKLLSYFDVMTDALFLQYQARGVPDRGSMIISKDARDADPLTCNGETFLSFGTLGNWFTMSDSAFKAGDCNGDGKVSIAEVQAAINMYLGLNPGEVCMVTDAIGSVSIAEVQKVINGYLGL